MNPKTASFLRKPYLTSELPGAQNSGIPCQMPKRKHRDTPSHSPQMGQPLISRQWWHWHLKTWPGQMQDARLAPRPRRWWKSQQHTTNASLLTAGLSKPWLVYSLFPSCAKKIPFAQQSLWSLCGSCLDGPGKWENTWATGFIKWDDRALGGLSWGLVGQVAPAGGASQLVKRKRRRNPRPGPLLYN